MSSAGIPITTAIEYSDRVHEVPNDASSSKSKKDSSYVYKISEITGIVSATREAFIQDIDSEGFVPENSEFKLPSRRSLFIIIGGNALFQLSFFVIVSSASLYAEMLGGSATFSGLTIGIPTVCSAVALIFITRIDGGQYSMPMNLSYVAVLLGNILYALAYRTHFLYLILIGRMVSGLGFVCFLYSKRYCSDPRIVGIRRRTTLASWLVVGQGFGFTAGPFLGGVLYKIGFPNPIFNGVTSPGWIMALVWVMFWGLHNLIFKDVDPRSDERPIEMSAEHETAPRQPPQISRAQWGVIVCMCYYSMMCFFILGSWEANIPVFTAETMGYSPYKAGNFIALGGLCSFPFLLLNVWQARRIQDRVILAAGASMGFLGLLLMLLLLATSKVTFGSLFVCWLLIALGFNLASTCTLSLASKQLPDEWNGRLNMALEYSNCVARVTGAVLGGAGVTMGMMNYVGVQIAVVGLGGVMYLTLWKQLKAKTG
ncbi:unnamed protein product [Cyclocybe aegerita]|uniref:Major facilitator superfamily transporter n=1 Tax=Cyclocybe aegerita TaxID=1973307 RepID=A0A8S0WFQ7_CYCAE|nr:unnamed protein product [Cyclocybe aegerita]